MSLRWGLRLAVFSLLAVSTVTAIVIRHHPWAGDLPNVWAYLPALCFAGFIGVFAADRLMAVQARGASAPRAMFQVGAALVFLTLLWPRAEPPHFRHRASLRPHATPEQRAPLQPALYLLEHEDAHVRAAICALLTGEALGVPHPLPPGHPLEGIRPALEQLAQQDPEPAVRHHCSEALGQLPPADPELEDEGAMPHARPPLEAPEDNGEDGDSDGGEEPLDDDFIQET